VEVIFLDERKQYVPTATRTYPAENDTIGITPESIVREANNKKTNYKNVSEIPVDTSESRVNSQINQEKMDKL
jgi:hypothetical protein